MRSSIIGGGEHSGEDFVIQITGEHHAGMLHEVLETLHAEGLDIVEAMAHVEGGERSAKHQDSDVFIVRPRGKTKDFDDEKLLELKKALTEMLAHDNGAIQFFSMDEHMHNIDEAYTEISHRVRTETKRRPSFQATKQSVTSTRKADAASPQTTNSPATKSQASKPSASAKSAKSAGSKGITFSTQPPEARTMSTTEAIRMESGGVEA
uniref:ACT domain-containing protein n=1 Tax=Haptolina brevifila TaxID=156173 RepID=A0A7S2CBR8_9EUKA